MASLSRLKGVRGSDSDLDGAPRFQEPPSESGHRLASYRRVRMTVLKEALSPKGT